MAYPIGKHLFRLLLLKPFVGQVTGLEHLPRDGNFIIAANHQSYIDSLIIGALVANEINRKVHFLGKREHFDGILGRMFNRWGGMIPIDREGGGAAAVKTGIRVLNGERILCIYPEGRRTLNGELQQAKEGIGALVLSTSKPVLPVGIDGTFRILPKGKVVPRGAKAQVHFGAPISFAQYLDQPLPRRQARTQITREVMSVIAKLCGQQYVF